ncbi:hypothetical protein UMC2_34941 [[Clostridium] sordellii]|uniref:hypothetical protein n=1 Tax=Paraclostridium sordellii TaxID=1505 RepID=UPI000541FD7D|nr:hypothetical protein [Paeniclostridium sordellii]CEK34283.1 hypothetical protein UMC2_34941 [[Clostridium] sordellii] [Paeniclostridium sordellii]
MKIHYFDKETNKKIPIFQKHKGSGTICGYIRKEITFKPEEVTCKLCLMEMKKKGIIK